MYYGSIGCIAIVVHIIINIDVLRKPDSENSIPAHKSYRIFLISVMGYYIADIWWGVMYQLNFNPRIVSIIGTEYYFAMMALIVFMWARYVVAYLNRKNFFTKLILFFGWFVLISELVTLIINPFVPIVFFYDDTGYHANFARYVSHFMQLGIFLISTVHMFLVATKTKGKVRFRHLVIGLFGLVMTTFIVLQSAFTLIPFLSVGYLVGTCLLHTFVLEDEKNDRRKVFENLIKKEKLQEKELGSARQLAYTDPLTGVKNKHAYLEAAGEFEKRISNKTLSDFTLGIFDLNGLKHVNDTKGHDAGDQYIKQGCKIICQTFKNSPVFRIGGDEFAALIEGDDYKNRAELITEFERTIEKNLLEGKVVVSSGFDDFNPDDLDFITIFERADKKMYERKRRLKESETHKEDRAISN